MSTAPSKKYCYFFVSIAGAKPRKIVFELFNDLVPLTCQNFLSFCESQDSSKTYKGTYFHRIIPGFMVQGGDYERNNGTGGETFDGGKLKDESFVVKHSEPGILSMANNGKPDSGKSQFFITTGKASHLDGKHVAFGRVIEGMSVVYDMESVETDEKDKPIFQKIMIVDCGIGEGTNHDNDSADDSSELSDRKSKESSRKRKKRSRKRGYSSEDSSSRKHRKRKSHKKKHRHRSNSSSSSFDDDDSYVRENKKSSSKKEKRKKKKKKYYSSDESSSDDSHHRRRTNKSHKKDRHGKKNERSKQSSDANSSFGKYGIIRDSDLLNNSKVKRSFEIWLEEVKGVPLGANVSKYDVTKYFKDYAEDFNTATLPHEKYYDYDKWEMEEYARKKEESYAKSSVLGDEFEHREEMKRKAEEKKKKEFETVKMLMSKDKIEDMKRQALLKAELANAYRVGDEETRKKIQRRLEQDD
jgi:cyclophilin family peptidyl-prolyl cis-trans isomerase